MNKHILTVFLSVLAFLSFSAGPARAYDKNAQRYMETAINQCERGMRAPTPQSGVSLQVLNRYLKKYQRYKEAALKADATLAQAGDMYSGDFFKEKTYQEVYAICDTDLANKVSQAEAYLAKKQEEDKAEFDDQKKALEAKQAYARMQIALAINQHCGQYIQPPALESLDSDAEGALEQALEAYKQARQRAMSMYPEILQEKHQALMRDAKTGQTRDMVQSVEAWFDYCDKVFPAYQGELENLMANAPAPAGGEAEAAAPEEAGAVGEEAAAAEEVAAEGPPPAGEPATAEEGAAEPPAEEPVDAGEDATGEEATPQDDYDAEMQAEFEKFLAKVKGDRAKVLQDEGRIPDFTPDNDENPQQANTWEFESEEGDKLKCNIYTFKGDTLANQKTVKKECP